MEGTRPRRGATLCIEDGAAARKKEYAPVNAATLQILMQKRLNKKAVKETMQKERSTKYGQNVPR